MAAETNKLYSHPLGKGDKKKTQQIFVMKIVDHFIQFNLHSYFYVYRRLPPFNVNVRTSDAIEGKMEFYMLKM